MCVLFLPPSFFSQRSARALVVRDPSGDLRAAQAQAELKRVDQHKHIPLRWPPWVCSLGWGGAEGMRQVGSKAGPTQERKKQREGRNL
jgi:hypothetical protein